MQHICTPLFRFLLIITAIGLQGCSTLTSSATGLNVYENIATEYRPRMYTKAYVVSAGYDQLNLNGQVAQSLDNQGIMIEQYQKSSFFAPQGTAFFITSSGYMLTCDHVIGDRRTLKLLQGDRRVTARVVFRDPVADLALIKVDQHHATPFLRPSSASEYRLGEDAYALGFPLSDILGTTHRLTKGIVSAKVGFKDEHHRFQISAALQPGNSGGPILNAQGQFMGVAQSTLHAAQAQQYTQGSLPQNVNFAVSQGSIKRFLSLAQQAKKLPMPDWQEIYAPVAFHQPQQSLIDFTFAEQATLFIQGQPQSQQEALVVVIDYTLHPQESLAPPDQTSIATKAAMSSKVKHSNEVRSFSELSSQISGFSATLLDFKTKTPLVKIVQHEALGSSQALIAQSLEQISVFFQPVVPPE